MVMAGMIVYLVFALAVFIYWAWDTKDTCSKYRMPVISVFISIFFVAASAMIGLFIALIIVSL